MTRNLEHHDIRRNATPLEHTPRLRLKAKAPLTGYVDGAWWPHSDSLAAELPDLLAVLSVRLGTIDRVLYRVGEWSAAPARLSFGDRAVRLDGYRYQPPNSVEILGLDRGRITLLVVPPGADPNEAHTAMMAAAAPQNASTVHDLLGNTLQDKPIGPRNGGPEQERWESDGGSSRQSALSAHAGKATE